MLPGRAGNPKLRFWFTGVPGCCLVPLPRALTEECTAPPHSAPAKWWGAPPSPELQPGPGQPGPHTGNHGTCISVTKGDDKVCKSVLSWRPMWQLLHLRLLFYACIWQSRMILCNHSFFFNIYVYVWVFFLHISVNICTPGIQRGHEGVLGALEQDLCLVVHYHVGSGNQTRALCKSSKCSESLVVLKMRSSGLGCTGDAWPPTAKSIWIWKLMKRMYIKCDSVLSPIHGISMWGGLASASFDNTVKLYQEDFTG